MDVTVGKSNGLGGETIELRKSAWARGKRNQKARSTGSWGSKSALQSLGRKMLLAKAENTVIFFSPPADAVLGSCQSSVLRYQKLHK